jgi:hypothetical protein
VIATNDKMVEDDTSSASELVEGEEEEDEEGEAELEDDEEEEGEEEGEEASGGDSASSVAFIDMRRRSEIEVDDAMSSQELAAVEARACTIDLPLPRAVLSSGISLRARPEQRRPLAIEASAAAVVTDPHEDYVRGIAIMRHYAALNGIDTTGVDSGRITVRSMRTRVFRVYSQLRALTGCFANDSDTDTSSATPSSLGSSDVSWVADSESPPVGKRRRISEDTSDGSSWGSSESGDESE